MQIDNCPVIGLTPFGRPDVTLLNAVHRSGALAVLDLGTNQQNCLDALSAAAVKVAEFGVLIQPGLSITPDDLPSNVVLVVLPAGMDIAPWTKRTVIVQVTSVDEARQAAGEGASGLIAKGNEAGGRVGEQSTFVLLQALTPQIELPIWAQGGIGLHTAAACVAGGAAGVVLDGQLALVRESTLPAEIKDAVSAMDGSETRLVAEHRIYSRPDLPAATLETDDLSEVAGMLGAESLHKQLLPAGQDAAFAANFAHRFGTAGGVVTAVESAIHSHLQMAMETQPLGPHSPLAESLNIEYPIAQGPMTRVSDRAEFANAVATSGGLPFLALSMMSGPQVRELLQDTQALLEDRTWGVGILGFVPRELREEQLAVIQEFKPPVALIAGGRPSQARPLEVGGTQVFLHVPSPGLLDLFLKDGARRFVFEGRECGGHVGPRTSFVLWDTLIERLLKVDDLDNVQVFFAGGIHDAASAAMVAAMAAPLAQRGAKIGVLMGTSYLFTEEAVQTGAIQPGFQAAAQSCERTVLVETAPGHATRCAESDYVRAFELKKHELRASGVADKDAWLQLEGFNLGRLRMASKGLRREGDKLLKLDDNEQRAEGMFMLGQVAALRKETCTIRELHHSVSAGCVDVLAKLPAQVTNNLDRKPVDIAIVGMAALFPGASDLERFWANIVNGTNSITEVSPDRWDADIYYDADSQDGSKTPSKWGGFLSDVKFDPLKWGIPPKSLAAIEPVQLLSLAVAASALEDAGYGEREFNRERTAVIFGAEAGTELAGGYGFRAIYPQMCGTMSEQLDTHLPKLTEDSFPGVLANVIAGRIANRLDLGGANYTVDAACASSLAAVDLGVKELVTGGSDMVLCGGADLHNSINDYLLFASVHALSRKGQCRSFDADADGITLGEGVGAVLLKRLSDAERDGDRIYSVIRGIGASSDGKSLGLTAPRMEGQVRALERAYAQAGVSPQQVGLVEAHGTGTVVGDKTELRSIDQVYLDAGASVGSVSLGSVKSNIGHTKCAAGIAGLIKMSLALHHKVLPPTLNLDTPNPGYNSEQSPFVFDKTARPWVSENRHAALSAFGFGGTNFHLVLSEYSNTSPVRSGHHRWPSELLVFRGESKADAIAVMDRVLDASDDTTALSDVAYTAASLGNGPVQFAVVASDRDDLREKVAAAKSEKTLPGLYSKTAIPGKIAFLIPGQGSQRPGMLADIFIAFPTLHHFLEKGERWLGKLYPSAAFSPLQKEQQRADITDTTVAQPTLGIVDSAMAQLLGELGIQPDMLAGHSYGELAALSVAGAIDPSALLPLSEARAKCILEAAGDDPGTMAAVSGSAEQVKKLLGNIDVVVANENSPKQSIISGSTEGVKEAAKLLTDAGLVVSEFNIACAFHSPVVGTASELFSRELGRIDIGPLQCDVWSNTTGQKYPNDADAIRQTLADHLIQPVKWVDQIQAMYDDGARIFIECGPGRTLTGLVGQILGDREHLALACDVRGIHGLTDLQHALATLATHGVDINTDRLFEGRETTMLDTQHPPTQPSASTWLVNGHRAVPVSGDLPDSAMRPLTHPIPVQESPMQRDVVVLEYLRNMRELVAAQRDAVLGYLGTAPVGRIEFTEHVSAAPIAAAPVATTAVATTAVATTADVQASVTEEAKPSLVEMSLTDALLVIVSERTGYPREMLALDLDLEADLSIDSIKRIEILGALSETVGLGGSLDADQDTLVEELAAVKTIRGIVALLESREGASDKGAKQLPEPASEVIDVQTTQHVPIPLTRYLLNLVDLPPAARNGHALDNKTFAITPDSKGVCEVLCRELSAQGAEVRIVSGDDDVTDVDGFISLATLSINVPEQTVKSLFNHIKQAVAGGAEYICAATGHGGGFGRTLNGTGPLQTGGVAGMMKSLAKEHPEIRACVVDLDVDADQDQSAQQLLLEMLAADCLTEVGYLGTQRQRLVPMVSDLSDSDDIGVPLTNESVILITGGARGITAQVAIKLAKQYQCSLELVGRTPLPTEDEPTDVADKKDLIDVRQALIARGTMQPAEIEAECRSIFAAREIVRTLAAIREAGAKVVYHAVDVRDDESFGALIDDVYTRHQRLDGVVHGAGVIEDKLLAQKSDTSFERVFDTKVMSALTLSEHLKKDVGFVVFFSSVSSAFGNRGQTDYAAANDALDKIAMSLNERIDGRVVSINWGPWSGTGMVSDSLEAEYAKQGVGLIDPEDGAVSLLNELTRGQLEDAQVILMRATPESLQ